MIGDIPRAPSQSPNRGVSPFPCLGYLVWEHPRATNHQIRTANHHLSARLTTGLRLPLIIVRAHSPSGSGKLTANAAQTVPSLFLWFIRFLNKGPM